MKKIIVLFTLLVFTFSISNAEVRLPAVLASNMVLQQQSKVKLWGWAAPAEMVYITTSWDNKTDSVKATRDANWQIFVQTPTAGGPYTITFKAYNSITLENVMIGEVWVCSGQSNMEMNETWGLPDVKAELPTCANKNIRFFYVPKTTSATAQDDTKASWTQCDSNTLKFFSAVGYFFGKKLNKDLNVPIGLINANWGGTPAEVWTPAELINNDAELKAAAEKLVPADWWPYKAGLTFNGMLAPITNFSIAGAIWYQGEGNTANAATYAKLLTTMIDSWRKAWDKNIPFYYVQIAPFTYGNDNLNGTIIREQQTKAMAHDNVGMVVVTDLVDDTTDIHPKNKHDVGYRLANWALSETYHKTGIVYKSPVYKSMEVQKDKAIISFDNVPTGLMMKDKNATALFIAGVDKIFHPAMAKIENDKLIAWSKDVPQPVAVRFSFTNAGVGNIFSKEGLPVAPFRTDDWDLSGK